MRDFTRPNPFDFVPSREVFSGTLRLFQVLAKDGLVRKDDTEVFGSLGSFIINFVGDHQKLPEYSDVIEWYTKFMPLP